TVLHCSTRRYWEPGFDGDERSLAAWARQLTGLPVIAVGSVTLGRDFKHADGKAFAAIDAAQIDTVNAAIERGDFDLIALGRALLANPDWANLVRQRRVDELRPFTKSALERLV
ncbi:MAG: 12-oxophytodienoate reductase, partial [Pseudomonadota bacterium]